MTLYTQELGPTTAPTIVFLHGGGVGGWMWKPQIAQLREEYHLLVPDLPEHGHSVDVVPMTLQNAAAQVAELIRTRAHGGRAHVVGLSLGAQTTIELLSQTPELIDRALASGPLMRPLPGIGATNLMAKMYWPFRNMTWLVKWNMKGLGVPAEYFEDFRTDTATLTIDGFVRMTLANGNNHVPPNLQAVTVPTLLLVGEKELKIVQQSVRDLLAVMPSAQGYLVSGAIHNWSLQLPDLFTQTVRARMLTSRYNSSSKRLSETAGENKGWRDGMDNLSRSLIRRVSPWTITQYTSRSSVYSPAARPLTSAGHSAKIKPPKRSR